MLPTRLYISKVCTPVYLKVSPARFVQFKSITSDPLINDDMWKDEKYDELVKKTSKYSRPLREIPSEKIEPSEQTSFIPKDLMKKRLQKKIENSFSDPLYQKDRLIINEEILTSNNLDSDIDIDKKSNDLLLPNERRPIIHYIDEGRSNWFVSARGTRKRAVANVIMKPGDGTLVVNDRTFINYFPNVLSREAILNPLFITEKLGMFSINCKVQGGGFQAQAEAIRLSISRALQNYDPHLRPVLKKAGFLERDQREVERKKAGQAKARKKYQWSKR